MNKKVVYTAITNDYDTLKNPVLPNPDWDYICFSASDKVESNKYWEVIPLLNPKKLDNTRLARYVKVNPHIMLPNYKETLWIDGNIRINCDIGTFINDYVGKKSHLMVLTHNQRKCIYDEAIECIRLNKDSKEKIIDQIAMYRVDKYPFDNGMVATRILYRKNNPSVNRFNEEWWKIIENHSRRDQLSFNYVIWKYPDLKFNWNMAPHDEVMINFFVLYYHELETGVELMKTI